MSARPIRKMSPGLSNKIAAGEVVDRPASVVKELLENAVDSGADTITLDVLDAGTSLIKVTDNGSGILENDIPLIFERHATSKIYTEGDIEAIRTLGFRGEALASIAAVAKVSMLSRSAEAEAGFKILWVEGECLSRQRVPLSQGTTVEVRDLFFNAPARKKFLKQPASENRAITHLVQQIAIANPSIRFTFSLDGKVRFATPGDGKILSVLYPLYGKELAIHMVRFDHRIGPVGIEGYVTDLGYHRGNRAYQSVFLNGRYIENSAILHAVNEAFRALIPLHRFPAFFIMLSMDPGLVDVNVHPNKLIVKIEGEEEIAASLQKALRDGLYEKDTLAAYTPPKSEVMPIPPDPEPVPLVKEREAQSPLMEMFRRNEAAGAASVAETRPIIEKVERRSGENARRSRDVYEGLRYIGQVLSTYLLFEGRNSLYVVDQHAAHEKILYERFMERFHSASFDAQQLLVPEIFTAGGGGAELAEIHADLFQRLGYDLSRFGEEELVIRGIPSLFTFGQASEMVRILLDRMAVNDPRISAEAEDRLIQASCKHAIKASDRLEPMEANVLIEQLKTLDDPLTCPHGRPIIIEMSEQALIRMFSRG